MRCGMRTIIIAIFMMIIMYTHTTIHYTYMIAILCIYLQSCKPEPLRKAKVICMTQAGVGSVILGSGVVRVMK